MMELRSGVHSGCQGHRKALDRLMRAVVALFLGSKGLEPGSVPEIWVPSTCEMPDPLECVFA